MSLDYQLAFGCPHLTVEETVVLGSDRRSLDVRQPVASTGLVRILADDSPVPSNGLFSEARLSGVVSGPFDVLAGENILLVESSGGIDTVTFPVTGSIVRRTTDQIVARIGASGVTNIVAENVGGFLVLRDAAGAGTASFVRVGGTVATALGFGASKTRWADRPWRIRGRKLLPGWRLHLRPDEITNRYPRFDEPVRSNHVFKVTYTVPVSRCLRCRGGYVENDFRFDPAGNALFVRNEDLLHQAALKILLTDVGSNPFHSWYGTNIRSRIGSKALGGVASLLSEDVRRALTRLQALQTQQAKYQTVTFEERLYAVTVVNVQQHRQDPSTFLIDVTVQNASGRPVSLSIVFTVPEVVSLMGRDGGIVLGPGSDDPGVAEAWNLFTADRNRLTGNV